MFVNTKGFEPYITVVLTPGRRDIFGHLRKTGATIVARSEAMTGMEAVTEMEGVALRG